MPLGTIVSDALLLTFIVCIHFMLFSSSSTCVLSSLRDRFSLKRARKPPPVTLLHAITAVTVIITSINVVYMCSRRTNIGSRPRCARQHDKPTQ